MKNRLTKFFTAFLAVTLLIGMSPATASTAYAASWNKGSVSNWFSSLFGGSNDNGQSSNPNNGQQEDANVSNNSVVNLGGSNNNGSAEAQLSLTKSITHNEGDNYTIKLEAYATGEVKTVEYKRDVPTDIVLVLDQSGSMSENLPTYTEVYNVGTGGTYYIKVNNEWKSVSYSEGGWGSTRGWYYTTGSGYNNRTYVTPKSSQNDTTSGRYQFYTRTSVSKTRLQALKDAVNTFVGQIQQKAATSDAKYRVAIVGFARGDNSRPYYLNTELFIGSNQYKYGSISNTNYQNAFQDMNTNAGKSNISASINALAAEGATRADLGMEMANNIFAANTIPQGEQRNRVVVMFTDGEPNNQNDFDDNVATKTINNSNKTKNTYGSSVYTIGILDGANPGAAIDPGTSDIAKINRYMNYVSSNFPNATGLNAGGTGGDVSKGFYKKADDADELNEVFISISESIESGSTQVQLDQKSVLQDVISDDFSLPDGVKVSDIVVKTADYKGGDYKSEASWKTPTNFSDAQVSISGKTINVSNFNYKELYAATINGRNQGKKLIVEIPVKINRSFGGNNILSNASAGIYLTPDSTEPFITVESPKGDHPTDYKVKGTEQWIDADNSVTLASLIGYITDDDDFEYKPDGQKNKYVDIVYTIKDKDGNTVGTYTVNHGETEGTYSTTNTPSLSVDTEYDIECTVTPISNPTADATASGRAATVETYTTTSYVYINGVDKAFVIDFAKPVTYTRDEVFSKNQTSTQAKIDAITKATATDTYGKLTLNGDKSITYSLNKFMDGIDTYTFKVACKADTQTVKMVPASSVYYEDNFGEDADGTNSIISYDDNWVTVNDGNIVTSINGDDPVGYDSAYEGNTTFSSGSAHKAYAKDKILTATFTFQGSGIDLYGYTNANTGKMKIQLYKLDANGNADSKATYTALVDTKYNSGEVYQTPLFSYMGTETAKYKVVVTIPKGSAIYLDALRVYYPIGKDNDNYKEDENNIEYVDVRDQIFNPEYFMVSGNLFVDEHANGHDTVAAHIIDLANSDDKAEYSTYGRKREVAIAPGSTVTLSGFKAGVSVKQIGMRTNAVAPDEFKLENPIGVVNVNGNPISLNSATDMYYNITVKDGKLVITNNTNYIITLTNLKLK